MNAFGGKFEDFWWKLLVSILVIFGPLIVIGYLYYRNSSCYGDVWNCLEFELIILGAGMLIFSVPIAIVLIIWEVSKFIKKKKEEKEAINNFK